MAQMTAEQVWNEYDKGVAFNTGINLYDTVRANENFYIGKQWEGVQANGLPTPVFNFIKRIVLFVVASTATDNLKMNASPLSSAGMEGLAGGPDGVSRLCDVINAQFEALFEQNKMGQKTREFMRNAAVDGDACLYSWFDPDAETGQTARGTIRVELIENTRVIFGDPCQREPQKQPYILISRRGLVSEAQRDAKRWKGEPGDIQSDSDETSDRFDAMTDGKVTRITKFWRDEKSGTIHAMEATKDAVIRPEWDTELKLYPISWMNWDYVQNCYHGQAAVTGLIPNQIFVNKMFAMTMISLMTTAYPKVVYDRTRISKWDNRVGAAIAVNGGDVSTVARAMDPAAISPQVGEFIERAISLTKEFMGATDAALGDTRPDNTSAIIALQKASSVPMELTKQAFFQCVEDVGRVWLDMMRVYYGTRYVDLPPTESEQQGALLMGLPVSDDPRPVAFDFSVLNDVPLSIKEDVGGSAYWSEIAQMNTLDNLLMNGQINVVDYLERVPNGYISNQQELIRTLRERMGLSAQMAGGAAGSVGAAGDNVPDTPVEGGGGYGELQRQINAGGADAIDLSNISVG